MNYILTENELEMLKNPKAVAALAEDWRKRVISQVHLLLGEKRASMGTRYPAYHDLEEIFTPLENIIKDTPIQQPELTESGRMPPWVSALEK